LHNFSSFDKFSFRFTTNLVLARICFSLG